MQWHNQERRSVVSILRAFGTALNFCARHRAIGRKHCTRCIPSTRVAATQGDLAGQSVESLTEAFDDHVDIARRQSSEPGASANDDCVVAGKVVDLRDWRGLINLEVRVARHLVGNEFGNPFDIDPRACLSVVYLSTQFAEPPAR
jgi:hypothetical protein